MTREQVMNVKKLCAGSPVGTIMRLLAYYPSEDIATMAEVLGCPNNKESVAFVLSL